MPDIILKVVSVDAALPAQAFARSFDANGGTIGRDESNTLSLPDKHRRVSRLHATVSFPGGVPTITNSSTSLPISVGEQQLDFGESMPINHGASIEIGPYLLQAHALSLDASPVAPSHAPGRVANAVADAQRTALPASPLVARQHTGMTVILPPPVAAPVPSTTPAAYNFPPTSPPSTSQPQPFAEPLPASMLGGSDLSDLLGGIGGAFGAPVSQPPMFAVPTPLPAPVQAPPPVYASPPGSFPPPDSAAPFGIPPAVGGYDPFADLLSGIGGSSGGSAVGRAPTFGGDGYAAPAPVPIHAPSGLSADPLAAFGPAPQPISSAGASQFGLGGPLSGAGPARPGAIPDHFNPFDLPSSTGRNDADPLSALLGGANQNDGASVNQGTQAAPSIDSLFQSAPSDGSDAALFGFSAQRPANDGTLDSLIRVDTASDPMSLFGESSAAPAEAARAMRNDSLEVGSAFQPPLPMRPARATPLASPIAAPVPFNPMGAPMSVQAMAMAPSAPPDVLTEAFLRGAGLTPAALPHGLTPEIMTTIGSLLRSATSGAIDMLAARAATKREVQASVTIISVQANNPLKFLPNADSALQQLLGKKMPGFMRADVAMKDAFEDLRAHEVGVIAGTRAALTEVLGKFDPAVLGDKLTKGSVLESLMPSARKAKLWDMYLERYLQIRREAEDDFQSIFGRAFVQAYELETARIKGDTSGSGGE